MAIPRRRGGARLDLSEGTYLAAMQCNTVREGLKKLAETKQQTAEQIAASEGVSLESEVVEGTRPKGRPYARVQTKNVGQEWGDRYTERRRILGRAANS